MALILTGEHGTPAHKPLFLIRILFNKNSSMGDIYIIMTLLNLSTSD